MTNPGPDKSVSVGYDELTLAVSLGPGGSVGEGDGVAGASVVADAPPALDSEGVEAEVGRESGRCLYGPVAVEVGWVVERPSGTEQISVGAGAVAQRPNEGRTDGTGGAGAVVGGIQVAQTVAKVSDAGRVGERTASAIQTGIRHARHRLRCYKQFRVPH